MGTKFLLNTGMTDWDPLKAALNSKSFCVLPWMHQYIGPQGRTSLCHSSHLTLSSFKETSGLDAWNNDAMKQVRLDMLNGKSIPSCFHCNARTKLGSFNYKNTSNRTFLTNQDVQQVISNTNLDGSLSEYKLFYLDVRFNNLCNVSCRMCFSGCSSTWAYEEYKEKKIGRKDIIRYPGPNRKEYFNHILNHLDTALVVYFAGGEPLLQKEHYDLLDIMLEKNKHNTILRYNTNLTKLSLGNRNIIDYWSKFKNVEVSVSVDGSGEKFEFWRHGSEWKTVLENLKELKKTNAKVRTSYTISWPNSLDMLNTHKALVDQQLIDIGDFYVYKLDFPIHYSLDIVPAWKKIQIERALVDHLAWINTNGNITSQRTVSMINAILDTVQKDNPHDRSQNLLDFAKVTKNLDAIRNQNFWQVYPEHNDMKDYIENHLDFKF